MMLLISIPLIGTCNDLFKQLRITKIVTIFSSKYLCNVLKTIYYIPRHYWQHLIL